MEIGAAQSTSVHRDENLTGYRLKHMRENVFHRCGHFGTRCHY